ncbi:hypothetical protein HRbin02_00168 [Candidatus Calditenuaceae archaeon HR02]|nr:hypothetical protein HRbin02_00168 [Candidatus Calditenuaceae archaeon HR02]
MDVESEIEELRHRVEALEQAVRNLLKGIGTVEVRVEVPKVIISREPVYIKVSENELYGRIILLMEDGFFESYRSPSEVARELHRRGWAPRDFKHVRPALEHLTALGILERVRDRSRRAYWVYRRAEGFRSVVSERKNETYTV